MQEQENGAPALFFFFENYHAGQRILLYRTN